MTISSANRWAAALELLNPEDRKWVAFDGQDKLEVLTDLQDLTERAKTRAIEKRWRFRRPGLGGETVILRDLFSKIVTWINHFTRIGDIVVQYDPIHAALPWAGVCLLLQVTFSLSSEFTLRLNKWQIAVTDLNKFECVADGVETIAHSIARCALLENIYLNGLEATTKSVQYLEETLVRLYVSVFIYLARAKKYFEQPILSVSHKHMSSLFGRLRLAQSAHYKQSFNPMKISRASHVPSAVNRQT